MTYDKKTRILSFITRNLDPVSRGIVMQLLEEIEDLEMAVDVLQQDLEREERYIPFNGPSNEMYIVNDE